MKMNNKNGFTLVELLVVIVILGALIALVSSIISASGRKTTDRLGEQMENNLKDAAKLYALENKLKNCHNCEVDNLNTECVTKGTEENEKLACKALGMTISLGELKSKGYFEDLAKHCYKMNGSIKMDDNDINILIYRYKTDYIVELNGISCKK